MIPSRAVAALLAVLLAALALPILLVPLPALLDYPNHLARLWLIGGGVAEDPFPAIYRLDWGALTNIGVDLAAVPLLHLLPVETVGRIFLGLGVALPVLGMVALNRALFGGPHWWQLGFFVVAWNLTILAGFLNFNIGLGLALLAAAADPWVLRRGPVLAFALRLGLGAGLMVVHVFALFFYAALLCGLALGPGFRGLLTGPWLRARLVPVLRAAAAPLAALLLLLLLAPALPGEEGTVSRGGSGPWEALVRNLAELVDAPGTKLRNALALFQTYRFRWDVLVLALLVAPALAALALRRLRAHAGLLGVLVALGLLYLVTPYIAMGTGLIDVRFAMMAGLVLLAALRPELPGRWAAPAAAAFLLALGLGRTSFVATVWVAREADVRAVERALRPVPSGAAVLPLQHAAWSQDAPVGRYLRDGQPTFGHLAALAVPWRHAFVPTLFTARGKQPISVRPPWSEIAVPEGPMATMRALVERPVWAAEFADTAPYLPLWRDRFDYVLLLNADMPDPTGPVPLPPELELVADEGFARLYRIRRDAGTALQGSAPPGRGG